jgi:AraC-like DNA-binding protein
MYAELSASRMTPQAKPLHRTSRRLSGTSQYEHLYILPLGTLYTGQDFAAALSSAQPAALMLCANYGKFSLVSAGDVLHTNCAVIAPQVPRQLDVTGVSFIMVQIDPRHPVYRRFCKILKSGVLLLGRQLYSHLDHAVAACASGSMELQQAQELFGQLITATVNQLPAGDQREARIDCLLASLAANPAQRLDDAAKMLRLTSWRTSDLFAEQVRLSFAAYQSWQKVKLAAVMLSGAKSLTEIAHEVGFSDSSHFSRAFKKFYGIQPSRLRDRQRVRLYS